MLILIKLIYLFLQNSLKKKNKNTKSIEKYIINNAEPTIT